MSKPATVESVKTRFELSAINMAGKENKVLKYTETFSGSKKAMWGAKKFLTLEEVHDEFEKDNQMLIKAYVEVLE